MQLDPAGRQAREAAAQPADARAGPRRCARPRSSRSRTGGTGRRSSRPRGQRGLEHRARAPLTVARLRRRDRRPGRSRWASSPRTAAAAFRRRTPSAPWWRSPTGRYPGPSGHRGGRRRASSPGSARATDSASATVVRRSAWPSRISVGTVGSGPSGAGTATPAASRGSSVIDWPASTSLRENGANDVDGSAATAALASARRWCRVGDVARPRQQPTPRTSCRGTARRPRATSSVRAGPDLVEALGVRDHPAQRRRGRPCARRAVRRAAGAQRRVEVAGQQHVEDVLRRRAANLMRAPVTVDHDAVQRM